MYTLLTDTFPAKQWVGLGLRSNLRFVNLDDNSETLQGPYQYRAQLIAAIDKYADETDGPFNIFCCGQYIGGTEV